MNTGYVICIACHDGRHGDCYGIAWNTLIDAPAQCECCCCDEAAS